MENEYENFTEIITKQSSVYIYTSVSQGLEKIVNNLPVGSLIIIA